MSSSDSSKAKTPVNDDQDVTVGTDPRPAAAESKKAPAKSTQPAETKPKT